MPGSAIHLTDQAAVAVRLGRAFAGEERATVGHLLLGLMAEPDGWAGHHIRQALMGEPALRLADHPGLADPTLAPLKAAFIAVEVDAVPAWTDDLLDGLVRTGGAALRDLLDHAGISLPELARHPEPLHVRHTVEEVGAPIETHGRGSLARDGASDIADRAVAHARALGPDTAGLLYWLGMDAETEQAMAGLPAVSLDAVIDRAIDQSIDGAISLTELQAVTLSLSLQAAATPPRI